MDGCEGMEDATSDSRTCHAAVLDSRWSWFHLDRAELQRRFEEIESVRWNKTGY